jgi:hypothetical protein
MATWRVHVVAPDNEKAKQFKEDPRFYKQLYSEAGTKITFEVPEGLESRADDIVKAAEALTYKATKEKFVDPLENVEGSADFW